MKEIETSKGKFIVTDMKGEVRINNVQWFFKLSEITEEEASSIVDLYEFQHNPTKTLYNLHKIGIRKWATSAIQSLHSLLESQGIEITQNTYIFKV